MSLGLIGIKQGMTRIFEDSGTSVPVTVISINGNFISRLKTIETDGYTAVQIAYGEQLTSRLERPIIGELKKAKLATAKGFKEFRVARRISDLEIGKNLGLIFFLRVSSLILQELLLERGLRVLLRGTISACKMQLTVILFHTGLRALLGNAKRQVGFSKGKKWRVKWEIKKEPCRN